MVKDVVSCPIVSPEIVAPCASVINLSRGVVQLNEPPTLAWPPGYFHCMHLNNIPPGPLPASRFLTINFYLIYSIYCCSNFRFVIWETILN